MKTIVFLGAKAIGCFCLEYLQNHRQELDIEVIAVGAGKTSTAHQEHNIAAIAAQHQIPCISSLAEMPECDFIISIQYHKILKARHIAKHVNWR